MLESACLILGIPSPLEEAGRAFFFFAGIVKLGLRWPAMSSLGTVLCFSRDPQLLELRRLVLLRAGFDVLTAVQFDAVRQFTESYKIDLLIAGHTLAQAQCEEAIRLAKTINPPIKTLVLRYEGSSPCAIGIADEELDLLGGPEALVAKVKELLAPPSCSA